MIVVSDTSPISGLIPINRLELLKDIYKQVFIPQVVYDELLVLETFGFDLSELTTSSWINVVKASNQSFIDELEKELDLGESEAISLAIELNAETLLIDEKRGRTIAERLGIEIIGLLGVLLEAKELSLISSVKPLLDNLIDQGNFRVSHSLYLKILKAVNEV